MVLRVPAGRMVGRDDELGRLLTLLDDAEAGRSVAALVSGDAGVGKTRLVSEVTRLAEGRGFTVLSGQCAELGDSVPYLPLADALRGAAQSTGVRDALSSRPALSRLLPEGGDGQRADEDRSGLARQQMFGAVLGLLTELAAAAPVLLVLEDLHWADASTRDLVTFLSRMLHRERVALIGTYRTDDLHRRHPLRPVVAELLRLPSVIAVDLAPLDPSALAEHLTAALAEHLMAAAPGRIDAIELNDIVARAEGNAYYAEELLAAFVGGDPAERRALPAGLAALLLSRVEQLSDTAQRVLRTAAVAGRRADDELVRAASGLAADEYEAAVREAVTHQLLVPDGTEGYVFRHASAARGRLRGPAAGGADQAARHDELAAGRRAAARVPGTAAELAQHCLASHDIPGAFAASVRAGEEAERLGAPAEAHRHYDQALALWERVAEPEKTAGMARGKLGLLSAITAADSGDYERAVHLLRRLRQALAAQAERGDTEQDVLLAARIGERLASYLMLMDDRKAVAEAVEVARATVDATPAEPPTWQYARAISTYANTLLTENDFTVAREQAERGLAAARAAGAPWVEADALVTLGYISNREGRNDEAIKLLTEAHKQAREAKVLGVELRAAYHLAQAHLELGDLAIGAAVAHEGTKRANQTGLSMAPFGLDVQHLHFQCHFADGKWDHAQEIADGFPVRVTSAARGLPVLHGPVHRRRARQPGGGGAARLDRALLVGPRVRRVHRARAARRACPLAGRHRAGPGRGPGRDRPHLRAALGLLSVRHQAGRGRPERASRPGGPGARRRRRASPRSAELAAAGELLQVAREGAAFRKRPKFILGPEGRGWLARAEAEYRRASGDNDPQAWQAVLDEFGPDYVYEIARTRWRLAEALAEAGRRDEAADQWRQAVQTADRLGARPLRRALDDLARRARIGTAEQRGDGAVLAALTSREREVLRLIAAGRSNREIASVLFIAPKTASVHVSNILGKLGAASRTEAAAIAHREGLVSQPSAR